MMNDERKMYFALLSYSKPTFEQVKSYDKCKNILRIIGLSKKKLKFEYDFDCDSDKIGNVYVRFVPLSTNKGVEEISEKKTSFIQTRKQTCKFYRMLFSIFSWKIQSHFDY